MHISCPISDSVLAHHNHSSTHPDAATIATTIITTAVYYSYSSLQLQSITARVHYNCSLLQLQLQSITATVHYNYNYSLLQLQSITATTTVHYSYNYSPLQLQLQSITATTTVHYNYSPFTPPIHYNYKYSSFTAQWYIFLIHHSDFINLHTLVGPLVVVTYSSGSISI